MLRKVGLPGFAGALRGMSRRSCELIDFAAEADQDVSGDVGMPHEAGQHAHQDLVRRARLQPAAALVRESNHPVDIGKIPAQHFIGELLLNVTRHRGGTVHTRDDGQVITRADPAVGAFVTHEGADRLRWSRRNRRGTASSFLARKIPSPEVVGMDMFARLDRPVGKTDDLPVFSHWRPVRNGDERDLMPRGYRLHQGDRASCGGELNPDAERSSSHGDIVTGTQDNSAILDPWQFHEVAYSPRSRRNSTLWRVPKILA